MTQDAGKPQQALETDIAIIGGGMAGASLALLLDKYCPQFSVTLVEQRPLPESGPLQLPSFDARATALSAGAIDIFKSLDVWPLLRTHCAMIERVHVSDRGHAGGAQLDERDLGDAQSLGAVVENAVLGPVLLAAVRNTGARLLAPATVTNLEIGACGAELLLQVSGAATTLCAQLVVVADGAESGLRKQLGIDQRYVDYHQQALVSTVEVDRPHCGVAYERFTARGPMALLPLPARDGAQRMALVWTRPDGEFPAGEAAGVEPLLALSERDFCKALQDEFGWRAGRILRCGERHHYPLGLSLSDEQVRSHVVLMGNAAHFLHPVAGQGFNLTLRDCETLAQVLARGVASNCAPGELHLLMDYAESRQRDQALTIGFSDRVPGLFSSANPWLQVARQFGLLGLALAPPLRSAFARQAAGLGL